MHFPASPCMSRASRKKIAGRRSLCICRLGAHGDFEASDVDGTLSALSGLRNLTNSSDVVTSPNPDLLLGLPNAPVYACAVLLQHVLSRVSRQNPHTLVLLHRDWLVIRADACSQATLSEVLRLLGQLPVPFFSLNANNDILYTSEGHFEIDGWQQCFELCIRAPEAAEAYRCWVELFLLPCTVLSRQSYGTLFVCDSVREAGGTAAAVWPQAQPFCIIVPGGEFHWYLLQTETFLRSELLRTWVPIFSTDRPLHFHRRTENGLPAVLLGCTEAAYDAEQDHGEVRGALQYVNCSGLSLLAGLETPPLKWVVPEASVAEEGFWSSYFDFVKKEVSLLNPRLPEHHLLNHSLFHSVVEQGYDESVHDTVYTVDNLLQQKTSLVCNTLFLLHLWRTAITTVTSLLNHKTRAGCPVFGVGIYYSAAPLSTGCKVLKDGADVPVFCVNNFKNLVSDKTGGPLSIGCCNMSVENRNEVLAWLVSRATILCVQLRYSNVHERDRAQSSVMSLYYGSQEGHKHMRMCFKRALAAFKKLRACL